LYIFLIQIYQLQHYHMLGSKVFFNYSVPDQILYEDLVE